MLSLGIILNISYPWIKVLFLTLSSVPSWVTSRTYHISFTVL